MRNSQHGKTNRERANEIDFYNIRIANVGMYIQHLYGTYRGQRTRRNRRHSK